MQAERHWANEPFLPDLACRNQQFAFSAQRLTPLRIQSRAQSRRDPSPVLLSSSLGVYLLSDHFRVQRLFQELGGLQER